MTKNQDLQTACNLAALMGFQLLPVIPWMKNGAGVSLDVIVHDLDRARETILTYIDTDALDDEHVMKYQAAIELLSQCASDLRKLPIMQKDAEQDEPVQQSQADDTSRSDAEDTTEDNSGEHAQS
jgi:hypothetical protein